VVKENLMGLKYFCRKRKEKLLVGLVIPLHGQIEGLKILTLESGILINTTEGMISLWLYRISLMKNGILELFWYMVQEMLLPSLKEFI
jgi:hypothetical protein